MNRKYIYALTALTFFALTGCVKLDTLPEGDTVTSSQKEDVLSKDPSKAIAGVNAIFAQFSQYEPNYSALGNRARHNDIGFPSIMFFTDANGLDLVSKVTGYNWMQADLNYSDRDFSSLNCQIVWNDLYSIIYTTNSVVGAISAETEDPTSQFYLAQGLATRAFSYWILAQLYQFDYAGHKTSPCVPIITNENSNQAALTGAPRATVDEVYTLINSDINKAIDLLKSAQDGGITRADKRYISLAVAYGLRARINLTMEKWAEAAADATSAINASEAIPASISDVSKPYFWDISEGDWMWGIIISETDDVVSSGIVNWISHMGSLNYGYANYSGGMKINKALYNSIPATDVRKGWWLDANRLSANITTADEKEWMDYYYGAYTQVKFAPYQNIVGNSINANDIPLMRIEEMYLIKAEAEAMSGADGKTTLENFVKQYRDPSYVCTVTAAADVQKEVLHQRRIELWGEGLSWFDIMRLKTGVDRRGGGFPNATMVFNIAPNADILLWRIPEKEMQANPGLKPEDNNPAAPVPTPVPDI